MKCKNCGKETEQIKAGKTRAGSQKYNANTVEKYTRQIQREGPIVKK